MYKTQRSEFQLKVILGMSALSLVLAEAAAQLVGPVSNPVPEPITKSGLRVAIVDHVQLPNTVGSIGPKPDRINTTTRINFMREAPDGRMFVNDLRGQLYLLDETEQPRLYVDLDEEGDSIFPNMNFDTGLAAGFTTFAFHPEFANNGVFYTIHSERPNAQSPAATFTAPDAAENGESVKFHQVFTEWTASDPAASQFVGSRREFARFGLTANNFFHPFGDISFNPHARTGDNDFGMMYVSGGDWGYINGTSPDQVGVDGRPGQLQRLDTLAGTMIRIDPRSPSVTGGSAGHGDYTIPIDNPFFDDANGDLVDDTLDSFGEIWAYGFRNGHRIAWSPGGELLVSSIGQAHLEYSEIVAEGGNYGWPRREGTFVNGVNDFFTLPGDLDHGADGVSDNVFELPMGIANGTVADGFEYPVLQFDHSEGFAHAGGFFYTGSAVPALAGKFVFGEVVNGRVFYAVAADVIAANDSIPETTAQVYELQLFENDSPVDLNNIVPGRVDLRFAQDAEGELYLLTKGDGKIRKIVAANDVSPADLNNDGFVDAIDYQTLMESMFVSPLDGLPGDLTGDDFVDFRDHRQFKLLFELVNGSGSFSALTLQIPEPSTLLLVVVGFVAPTYSGRRPQHEDRSDQMYRQCGRLG